MPAARNSGPNSRRFLLWDSSVVIPYYLPQSAKSTLTVHRSHTILDSVRNHRYDAFCFIPNIVVAEVYTALDRACYSDWDTQVNKQYGGPGKCLDTRTYRSARKKFRNDIHNGALFYQYELNRYHILALDLIAPVDKHMKIYRTGSVRSMGASDLLIGAMALHMTKIHGPANVALLTSDRRMDAIFCKACSRLNSNTAKKLGIVDKAKELGFGDWSQIHYPHVIDLERCSDANLQSFFGEWPLKTRKFRGKAPKA